MIQNASQRKKEIENETDAKRMEDGLKSLVYIYLKLQIETRSMMGMVKPGPRNLFFFF